MIKRNTYTAVVGGGLFFVFFLGYYCYLAASFPSEFNVDNHLNVSATRYLVDNHTLPIVEAEQSDISFSNLGTTRSLRPPLTYITSAIIYGATASFIESDETKMRLGSAFLGAITIAIIFIGYFVFLESLWLSILGALLIGLLPRYVFLATCNNDDIGAIFSGSLLICSMLCVHKVGATKLVIGLFAFAIGLVLQTKFTAWLLIPWIGVFLLLTCWFRRPTSLRLSHFVTALSMFFIAGGWWPVFNMVNYGLADPTAMKQAASIQMSMNGGYATDRGYWSLGISSIDLLLNRDDFLVTSFRSFVGHLSWIELDVGDWSYWFYGLVFTFALLFGVWAILEKNGGERLIVLIVMAMIISQFCFYLHHNLARDVQPQARYILPIIMALVVLFLMLLKRVPSDAARLFVGSLRLSGVEMTALLMMLLTVMCHFLTMRLAVLPSYQAHPYYMSLLNKQSFPLKDLFQIERLSGVDASFDGQHMMLTRKAPGDIEAYFDDGLCKILRSNARVDLRVQSRMSGDLSFKIYRKYRDSKPLVYWHEFSGGDQLISIFVKADECLSVGISLGRTTNFIRILSLEVQPIRVHAYSMPI
ncbi:hypothetical protein NBRC116583_27540 [Arenicella sp. 4NH20-0111]|uniref:hypothetical protein n=1 Tax=Arenicella sp. 4NH20-0111 TaxID=3127648 RepID=UPI00310644E0